jgi:hypothetical protein
MSFIFGKIALPRWAVAKVRRNATIIPDLSRCYFFMHTQNCTIFITLSSVVRLFVNSVSFSCSEVERERSLLYIKRILYAIRLCLKVLEPCAKVMVQIFKAGCYDSISQTVFTVRDFGEFTKALKNFLQGLRFLFMFSERDRDSLFF